MRNEHKYFKLLNYANLVKNLTFMAKLMVEHTPSKYVVSLRVNINVLSFPSSVILWNIIIGSV